MDLDTIASRCQVVFLSFTEWPGLQNGTPLCWGRGVRYWIFLLITGSIIWIPTKPGTGSKRDDQATVAEAVYGLPELFRDRIRNARLIGCPRLLPHRQFAGHCPPC